MEQMDGTVVSNTRQNVLNDLRQRGRRRILKVHSIYCGIAPHDYGSGGERPFSLVSCGSFVPNPLDRRLEIVYYLPQACGSAGVVVHCGASSTSIALNIPTYKQRISH
jgi:hypothetical protein